MADAILFFAYGACFWLGGWLIDNGYMEFSEFDDIYKSMIAIVFGALTLGQNSSFMSNYAAAIQAGERVLGLLNKEPLIDAFNTGGVEPQSCHGHLKVKGVNFAYPTRPKNPVMSDFSIEIKP